MPSSQSRSTFPISLFVAAQLGIILPHVALAKDHVQLHTAILGIVVQDKTIDFAFEAPALTLYGFDHEPKSPNEQQKVDQVIKLLSDDFSKNISFDPDMTCKWKSYDVADFVPVDVAGGTWQAASNNDSNAGEKGTPILGQASITVSAECPEKLQGRKLTLSFWSHIDGIKAVMVRYVEGSKAKQKISLSKENASMTL